MQGRYKGDVGEIWGRYRLLERGARLRRQLRHPEAGIGRMLARVRRKERAAHRRGGRHALATAPTDVRLPAQTAGPRLRQGLGQRPAVVVGGAGSGRSGVRQPFLLRDELVYPYPLRLLLLARGFGCRARLLRLPCLELALELLVWQARRDPARRGVAHGVGGLGVLRARGLG